MVPRTAWAGRAPDGMMDSLLSFLPSVKARKHLWERGQALWTERMTQAISGPCGACRNMSDPPVAGPTISQPHVTGHEPYAQAPDPYTPGAAATAYQQSYQPPAPAAPPEPAYPGATSLMPDYGSNNAAPPDDHGATSVMQTYGQPSAPAGEDPADATTALPAFLSQARPSEPAAPETLPPLPPPVPDVLSDEHESHTVMLSAPANLRAGPRLIVLEGPVHGRQFTLGRQLTTIGRSIGCHVTVESDAVGYDHARVVRMDDGWRIEPLSSAGETFVNDDAVREPRTLQSGDIIRIGPARMRFESVS